MMDKPKFRIEDFIQKTILIAFVFSIIGLISFAGVSVLYLAPVEPENEAYMEFVVKEGWAKNTVAEELAKAGLIKSPFFFKFYIKVNDRQLYAGTYQLSKSMSTEEIIKVLNSSNSLENETLVITFIEGKRLPSYAKKISEVFGHDEAEVMAKLSDETYLKGLIQQYWFITDDILNKDLYYPLEGYLFPDTYIIKKNASIEDILGKMLLTMDSKLKMYKTEIELSKFSVHQLLTMASIVELEGINPEDRAQVAGVFYNRIKDNWTLGSDVTTYYAVKKDFTVDLTKKDLAKCNPYNTRAESSCAFTGLPVGPICGASLSAITGAIEPAEHDYYYFVADKNNKTWLSKTYADHVKRINQLKKDGLWFTY